MAKQVGPLFFTGTIDGLIFYKLGDKYYTRSKGSYKSARHMRRNPKYTRTMQQADQFGAASRLTRELYYRHVPKAARKHGLFGKLTGLVNSWLQKGKSKEEVKEMLIAYCQHISAPNSKVSATTMSQGVTSNLKVTTDRPSQATPKYVKPSKPRVKQARYFSNWMVKKNGRLYIPKPAEHGAIFHSNEGTILPNLIGNSHMHSMLPNVCLPAVDAKPIDRNDERNILVK